MENNIDDIFNKAIEPLQTEPSDDFWRKAAENIIARGSEATEKKVARWRGVAIILGTGLLILGYFTYKIENGLENVDKQITAVKNIQDQSIAKWSSTNTPNKTKNAAVAIASNKTSIDKKPRSNNEVPLMVSSYSQAPKNNPIITDGTITTRKTKNSLLTSPSVAFNQLKKAGEEHKRAANMVGHKGNEEVLTDVQQQDFSPAKEVTGNDGALPKVSNETVSSSLSNGADSQDTIADTTIVTSTKTANAPFDSSKIAMLEKPLLNDSISVLRVSAYFSPDFLMGYGFKATNASGAENENTVKNGEKVNFSYTTGASTEYALSPNFSISAGLAYQVFSFTIKPTTIYNQKQSDGDEGYYITTSSGIIDCPYSGYSKLGDGLIINASSTRKYMEVPLTAKYFFINGKKFRAYITAGIEVNFSLGENTVMNWQNIWNESGTDNITNAEGSRNMYFSYCLGMGISYKVARDFAVYIEPGLHNAVTPIDDNIALITYPRLFSVSGGLIYTVR